MPIRILLQVLFLFYFHRQIIQINSLTELALHNSLYQMQLALLLVLVGANKRFIQQYSTPLCPSVAQLGDAHDGRCGSSTNQLLGLV